MIGARRASWRIISSIEQKEESKGNDSQVAKIKTYRQKVESELSDVCTDILSVLDDHLIKSAEAGESKVFYHKMKGDYHRYLAEFASGDTRDKAAEAAHKSYQEASDIAATELPPTHPIRLGLALNYSVFFYEILNSPEKGQSHSHTGHSRRRSAMLTRGCPVRHSSLLPGKERFRRGHRRAGVSAQLCEDVDWRCELSADVVCARSTLSEESYKDSTLIMQLLRDNLT